MAQTDNVEAVRINVEPAKKSIGELKKELQNTNEQLELLDRGSDAFAEAAQKASKLQQELQDVNQAIELSNKGVLGIAEATAQTAAGIVGGFQSAQAALNLFGVESEATTEAIAKMQSMMALTQGLQGLAQGIRSFKNLALAIKTATAASKGLKVALASTGIGLLAVAAGEVVAHFEDIAKWWDELGSKKPIEAITPEQQESIDKANENLKNSKKAYEDLVEAEKVGNMNDTAKEKYQTLQGQSKQIEAQVKMLEDIDTKLRAEGASWEEIEANAAKHTEAEKQRLQLIKQKNALLDDEKSYVKEVKKEVVDTAKIEAEAVKEREALKAAQIALKAEQDETYKDSSAYYLDTLALQREQLGRMKEGTSEYVRQQAEIEKTKNALKALYTETGILDETGDPTDLIMEDIENRLAKVKYDEIAGNLTAQEALDEQITLETLKLNEIEKGTAAYYNQLAVIEQLKQGTKEASKGASDYASVAVQGMNIMSQTLSAFASLQDTTTEEGFENQKKLQISATVMNMLGGILSAWVSAMNPANAWMTLPGQIAMGVAQTVATAALGAAQIKSIQSSQFGSSTGATTNTSAINSTVLAPTQYNNAVTGAQTYEAVGAQKVYVVEGEITKAQGKVSVAESEAKF